MDKFQQLAVTTALKQLFEGGHFSICTVDKCLKITGCIPNQKDYEVLSALHCISYAAMSKELRDLVILKTLQMFEQPGFDVQIIEGLLRHESRLLN